MKKKLLSIATSAVCFSGTLAAFPQCFSPVHTNADDTNIVVLSPGTNLPNGGLTLTLKDELQLNDAWIISSIVKDDYDNVVWQNKARENGSYRFNVTAYMQTDEYDNNDVWYLATDTEGADLNFYYDHGQHYNAAGNLAMTGIRFYKGNGTETEPFVFEPVITEENILKNV